MMMMFTWLSRPSVMSMKKKSMDQKGGPGRFVTASGYTTNARPAPARGIECSIKLVYHIALFYNTMRTSDCGILLKMFWRDSYTKYSYHIYSRCIFYTKRKTQYLNDDKYNMHLNFKHWIAINTPTVTPYLALPVY